MDRWIVLLCVAALFAFWMVPKEAFTQNLTLDAGYTYAGTNSMNAFSNQPTSESCAALCETGTWATYCEGIEFDAAKKTCQMKEKLGEKIATPGKDFYKKKVAPVVPGYQLAANNSYAGNDILVLENSTAADCAAACTSNADCKGTNFDMRDNKCYLKNAFGNPTSIQGVHAYKKIPPAAPAPAGYALLPASYYGNAPIIAGEMATVDKCISLCTDNQECTNVLFESVSNVCMLQKEIAGTPLMPFESYNTYVKIPPASPAPADYLLEEGYAYTAQKLGSPLESTTSDKCASECAANTECQGFEFDSVNNSCTLQKDYASKTATNGFNTYRKKMQPTAAEGYTLEPDTNYAGGDYGNSASTTPEACNAECTQEPTCKGTVFDGNTFTCYLKSSISTRSDYPGAHAYLKTETPLPAGYTLYKADTQYEGTFTSPVVSNTSDCMTACSGLPGCQGIGSDAAGSCRLYTEFSEASAPLTGYSTYKYAAPEASAEAGPEPSTTTSSVPVNVEKPVLRRFIKKKK